MKVAEVMTKNPACCWPSNSALSAATTMQQRDTGILPVVHDAFSRVLVGVLTDRDLCLHVVAGNRDPAHIWVGECMTPDPICCTAEDDVLDALERMKDNQIRRLPVVNEKHEIIGLLGLADVICKNAVPSEKIAGALATICEPGHRPKKSVAEIITAA